MTDDPKTAGPLGEAGARLRALVAHLREIKAIKDLGEFGSAFDGAGYDEEGFRLLRPSEAKLLKYCADRFEAELDALLSAPVVSPPQEKLMNMPVWKCKVCGCLWRDNLDETVSLLNAEQKSCASCEHSTPEACAIDWLQVVAQTCAKEM